MPTTYELRQDLIKAYLLLDLACLARNESDIATATLQVGIARGLLIDLLWLQMTTRQHEEIKAKITFLRRDLKP